MQVQNRGEMQLLCCLCFKLEGREFVTLLLNHMLTEVGYRNGHEKRKLYKARTQLLDREASARCSPRRL